MAGGVAWGGHWGGVRGVDDPPATAAEGPAAAPVHAGWLDVGWCPYRWADAAETTTTRRGSEAFSRRLWRPAVAEGGAGGAGGGGGGGGGGKGSEGSEGGRGSELGSDRGSELGSDRGSQGSDRGSQGSDRGSQGSDRGSQGSDRGSQGSGVEVRSGCVLVAELELLDAQQRRVAAFVSSGRPLVLPPGGGAGAAALGAEMEVWAQLGRAKDGVAVQVSKCLFVCCCFLRIFCLLRPSSPRGAPCA